MLKLIFPLFIIPLVYSHSIEEANNKTEPKYGILFHIYGLGLIILSSSIGTVLPLLLKNKSFFSVNGILFNSLKMFGTGVIVTVAFVHMLSPADKLLSGEDAPEFFKEKYDAFSGVFAVIGLILAHAIQVIVKEYFNEHNKNGVYNTIDDTKPNFINVDNNNELSENDSLLSQGNIDNDKVENQSSTSNYHTYQNNAHEHLDNSCCHTEVVFLNSHKQIVSYLLEIGISLHSILIGFAFGTNFDDDINFLLVALMIHQFFEGIALSTIFIEAKFKNMLAPIIMVIFYSITMPLGGIGGLIVYKFNHSNTTSMTCIQGILDSIAAGLLIYDSIVNILSHYTSSKHWDEMDKFSKIVQLSSFYLGCIAMALVGIWA